MDRLLKWQTETTDAANQDHRQLDEIFVLARVCDSHGLSAQAAQLCYLVAEGIQGNGSDGRPVDTFRERVPIVMGSYTVWRLMDKALRSGPYEPVSVEVEYKFDPTQK